MKRQIFTTEDRLGKLGLDRFGIRTLAWSFARNYATSISPSPADKNENPQ